MTSADLSAPVGSGEALGSARLRRPGGLAVARFRRDRLSVVAAGLFALILVASFTGGVVATAVLGHSGNELFPYAIDWNQKPVGPMTHVYTAPSPALDAAGNLIAPPKSERAKTLLVFGADGPLGRDELIRVLDGGKTSLEIALGGMLIALLVGVPLGALAGYFGGVADTLVSRVTEMLMAFPLILFLIFASVRLNNLLRPIGYGSLLPQGVLAEALLIGVFTSFYPIRLVRARILPLRNAEFVEAADMVGASNARILRHHLLPHLVPMLLVWGAVAAATNILLEVGLSFIGAGVQPQTPTWGSLLSTTWGTVFAPQTFNHLNYTAWQTIFPTAAILLTVLSLNQISEGLRRALEPRSSR